MVEAHHKLPRLLLTFVCTYPTLTLLRYTLVMLTYHHKWDTIFTFPPFLFFFYKNQEHEISFTSSDYPFQSKNSFSLHLYKIFLVIHSPNKKHYAPHWNDIKNDCVQLTFYIIKTFLKFHKFSHGFTMVTNIKLLGNF